MIIEISTVPKQLQKRREDNRLKTMEPQPYAKEPFSYI
jgi:hypothetical protein